MGLTSTRELVAVAVRTRAAVVAFNVITLEHVEAVIRGAETASSPVILQVSENAIRYRGDDYPALLEACRCLAERADVGVALHLDHVTTMALLMRTADVGFSSAMFDGGHLSYSDNVAATRAAAVWARRNDVWLEAEIGYVGGKPDAPLSAHAVGVRTDPDEAGRFVAETGVDALAVAVGNSHAMRARVARLDLPLVARLSDAVPVPLVLHGSSGVSREEIIRAVGAGIRKINVGTGLNLVYTASIRESLRDEDIVDPRPYLTRARAAMHDEVVAVLSAISPRSPRA